MIGRSMRERMQDEIDTQLDEIINRLSYIKSCVEDENFSRIDIHDALCNLMEDIG